MENLKSKSKQAHETTTSLSSIYEIKDLRQLFEEELKDMYCMLPPNFKTII